MSKQTAMQELISEIVNHLTYDDDLTKESRETLEQVRLKCISKLAMEREQIEEAFNTGKYEWDNHEEASNYYTQTY